MPLDERDRCLDLLAKLLAQALALRIVVANRVSQLVARLDEESRFHSLSRSANTSSAGIARVRPALKALMRAWTSSAQTASSSRSGRSRLVSNSSAMLARS